MWLGAVGLVGLVGGGLVWGGVAGVCLVRFGWVLLLGG